MPFSYAVAVSYVLVDTYDKGHLAYLQAGVELKDNAELSSEVNLPKYGMLLTRLCHAAVHTCQAALRVFSAYRLISLLSFERSLDTVVWQLLASVICPGVSSFLAPVS